MTQTFYTHDNGGRPFKVEVTENNIKVYKRDKDEYKSRSILNIKTEKVFIGNSPLNKMTEFSGGHGEEFDGNSFLLKMGKNKYMFIGHSIFTFKSLSEITEYVSPVGNNDVPYPYAIDDNNNYYLMIESVVVRSWGSSNRPRAAEVVTKVPRNEEDPYYFYYDRKLITEDLGSVPPTQPVIKHFQGIDEFYIDDDQYTLRYHPFPGKYYTDLRKRIGKNLYVVKTGGKKHKLTKEKYVKLMKDFGKKMGFRPMRSIKVVQKRS